MRNVMEKASTANEPKRRIGLANFLIRLVREKPLGAASAIVILILIVVGILADVLAPYPYDEVHLVDRMQGASARYLLGTDQLGRDFLSRIIYGARTSLLVGLAATALNVVVAVLIGGTSGFIGGKFDLVVQRFVDAWMGFPGLLLLFNHHVHSGAGYPTDNTGPWDIRRHRRLENTKKRRYWHKRECVFSDGGGDRLIKMDGICPTCRAQYYACRNHQLQHQHWRDDPVCGFSELPRFRSAIGDS